MKRTLFFYFSSWLFISFSSTANAVSIDQFKLNGFFDLEYEKSYSDEGKIGDTKGSFDQYHFNLLMEFPVSDTLVVKAHVEYEHAPQLPSKGDLKIEWSYLEYLINNNFKLRGGIVLTPFGIYNEIHDATPSYLSVRVPWGIYRADKVGGFPVFPKFSTGANLLGGYFSEGDLNLNYVLYVANGENATKNEAESDENADKAIGGRLMISPIAGLTLGGSFFTGDKQASATSAESHSAWLGTVDYSMSHLSIRAEYASSKKGSQTEAAWYGEASYRIKMVTPFVRYGTLDPDDDKDKDEWAELVYGINCEVQPNVILKLENRNFNGDINNLKIPNDYNEVAAALTVAF